MSKCPFHIDSTGASDSGEIESIRCSVCGDYRISKTALDLLQSHEVPNDWFKVIGNKALISTRDTRLLL